MPITVELIGATDAITFYHEPSVNGWVYNNVTLDRWYALAETDPKLAKRANAHGAFGLGKVYTKEHRPIVAGQFYGATSAEALAARQRLVAMYSDGDALTMRVTDESGATTRTVWLLEVDSLFRYDFSHFPFDVSLVAPDPRRYAASITVGPALLPSAGSGLYWDLGTAPSTLFFDWGTAGESGQVSFTNTGAATTLPRIEVGGAGAFAVGFRITEIETGRELTLERTTNTGEIIVLDSRTQRATLAGGDVTGDLSSRDWFEIPAGATRRYQINSLGAVSGAPTMTLYAAPAYL